MEWKSFIKKNKSSLRDKIVLITGAAQGIGYYTASEFADAGSTLILTDINEEKLTEARISLEKNGVNVHAFNVNVANKTEVENLAEEVDNLFGKLDILINNAGVGHHDDLEDTGFDTWKKLIDINLWGALYHIYAFLPLLKKSESGHIVNVSSGQAFFRMPTWGAYASIKLAMGAISEILHYELKRYGLKVTTVYPYMVNTGFYNKVESESIGGKLAMLLLPLYAQKPEKVAKIIFRAVSKGKRIEMVNPINVLGKYLNTFPLSSDIMNRILNFFMSEASLNNPEKIPGFQAAMFTLLSLSNKIQAQTEGIGFMMDETMQGEHSFEPGFGSEGKKRMSFRVTWGTKNLFEWLNPLGPQFMMNELNGTVTVDGLCENAICTGKLELKYFTEQKIRYTFEFESNGQTYVFVGEKRNIYPWNLPYSHTCCFGELREKESNTLISKSITHFDLSSIPEFLGSFRFG
jgi:NADP-dependent 3-hydroxy acid dehydrogenase YdfG